MAEQEVNKTLARPLAITAGILGIVQGIVWLIFSILCICCHFGVIENQLGSNIHYYDYIYTIFLQKNDGTAPSGVIITSKEFFIFMWFYVPLSLLWLALSSSLLWVMLREKWDLSKYIFGGWSILTFTISTLDAIFMALIAHDYKYVEDNSATSSVTTDKLLITYGIIMSMAARGYVLWLINIIFAGIIIKFTIDLIKSYKSEPAMPIIYGYDTASIQPPWQETSKEFWATSGDASPYYTNRSFAEDNRSPDFQSSQSFFPALTPSNQKKSDPSHNQNNSFIYSSPLNNISKQENTSSSSTLPDSSKLAKIGKPGRGSPPNNSIWPIIPDPDYTPPSTPTGLKSVLRSKSHY